MMEGRQSSLKITLAPLANHLGAEADLLSNGSIGDSFSRHLNDAGPNFNLLDVSISHPYESCQYSFTL
jgi:hypothetical protein